MIIRDSAFLAGILYRGGRTDLRPVLREQLLAGRHIAVATLKGSSSLPVFNSTLHSLLRTGTFVVGTILWLWRLHCCNDFSGPATSVSEVTSVQFPPVAPRWSSKPLTRRAPGCTAITPSSSMTRDP